MSHYPKNGLMARMNVIEEKYDKIFLLEEENNFEKYKLSEIFSSENIMFASFELIYVCYGKKETKCYIKDLKKHYDFIKIISSKELENNEINNINNNIYNEINFLILKNKNYSTDQILEKINAKKIFGDEIKTKLDINAFPLNNYFLEEYNNLSDIKRCYYDKVYIIKKNINIKINKNPSLFDKNKSINVDIININISDNSKIDKNQNYGIKNIIINDINKDTNNNNKGNINIKKMLEKFDNFELKINQMENDIKNLINKKFLELDNDVNSLLNDLNNI